MFMGREWGGAMPDVHRLVLCCRRIDQLSDMTLITTSLLHYYFSVHVSHSTMSIYR